jgi:hypothetical protein
MAAPSLLREQVAQARDLVHVAGVDVDADGDLHAGVQRQIDVLHDPVEGLAETRPDAAPVVQFGHPVQGDLQIGEAVGAEEVGEEVELHAVGDGPHRRPTVPGLLDDVPDDLTGVLCQRLTAEQPDPGLAGAALRKAVLRRQAHVLGDGAPVAETVDDPERVVDELP